MFLDFENKSNIVHSNRNFMTFCSKAMFSGWPCKNGIIIFTMKDIWGNTLLVLDASFQVSVSMVLN